MANVTRLPPPGVPHKIGFPSGLKATVRKIRGAELNALAQESDESTVSDGGFGAVLSPCWLETADPGPYPNLATGSDKPVFSRLLKGDLLYGFIFLRRISKPDGDLYDFPIKCEECDKRYDWTLKLTDLPIRVLTPESQAVIKSGRPFSTTLLSDGRAVTFHPQYVPQEDEIRELMRRQKREKATILDILAAQTVTIDGVGPDMRARWRFLGDLDIDDLEDLQAKFEAVDCGVDTAIRTRCTNAKCKWTQDINLPFGKSFFARKRSTPKAEPDEDQEETDDEEQPGTNTSSARSSGSPARPSGQPSQSSGGNSTGAAATED